MHYLFTAGRNMFAAGMLALGLVCFIEKDFIVGRPPAWPAGWHINPVFAYITGALVIACALAILFNRKAVQASFVLAAGIALFSLSRHVPAFMTTWPNGYKTIALVGSCCIMAVACNAGTTGVLSYAASRKWLLTGIVLLAVFLLACGYAHFKYAAFVDTLIPAYIPFHSFFTYFCGVCLLAAGIGLLIPATRQLAALLSGIMIAGWFLLLHIPRFVSNMNDSSDRMGLCESFAFAGVCFCLAGLLSGENKFAATVDKTAYLSEII